MASLETLLRLGYMLVIVSVLLMIWVSLSGANPDPQRYPPCYFNPLCSCSKAVPDLGIVRCYDVPLPRIPPPVNNSKVFMLHMDNNGLRFVEPFFLQSTGLYGLEISNNPIHEIPDEAFIGLERSLWELELRNTLLTRVPSRALRHLQKLRLLDLSGNDIMEIEADNWRGLGNSLQDLILSENAIHSLPPDAFTGLPMLETIDLRGNNLREIDPSVFSEGMSRLSHVILADNLLKVIPYQALSPLRSLKTLDLSLNRIVTMDFTVEHNQTTRLSVQLSLDELRLDYNQITELPTQCFQYFGVLNETFFDGNPLEEVEADAFRPARIRELYLRDCGLTEISPAAFGGLESSLQVLDLSGNNITSFSHNMFSSYDYLRSLSLRNNKFSGLKPDDIFSPFEYSLYQLDLSGPTNEPFILQDLKKLRSLRSLSVSKTLKFNLEPEDFAEFGVDLEDLQITRGNIQNIKDHAFKNVKGIKRLDLSENKIEKIENDAFLEIGHTLTNLRIAHGLSNNLKELPAIALRPLTELQYLDLSNNKLFRMSDTSFHFLKKIRRLELQDNELNELLKGTFQGDIHSSLEEIYLSFNNLKLVQQHTFVDLSSLEQIHLDDNQIDRLERRSFMNLNRLKLLNLRGNKINSISDETFQNLPELDVLDLAYNSLKTFDFAMFDQVGTLALLKVNASHNKIKDLLLDVSSFTMGRETGTTFRKMGDTTIIWENDTSNEVSPSEATVKNDKLLKLPINELTLKEGTEKEPTIPKSEPLTPRKTPKSNPSAETLDKHAKGDKESTRGNDAASTANTSSSQFESPRRRHNRNNIFDEEERNAEQQIFSKNGTPNIKINRHQDKVTVFPNGCMGIKDKDTVSELMQSPRRFLNSSEMAAHDSGHIDATPRKRPPSARHDAVARNPLTGEGYADSDFVKTTNSHRRADGNPVLGSGYKENGSRQHCKIPPGGFSKGLW